MTAELRPNLIDSTEYDYDLAVIGGGPGGYVSAICGVRKGLRTVLIERDALGGTCLNRGCIPTKSFHYDTRLFRSAALTPVIRGREYLTLDVNQMVERKASVVNTLVSGLTALVNSRGVEVVQGEGVLESPGRIRVKRPDGSVVAVKVKHIILATGSKPNVPPFIGIDGKLVQTTDEILDDPGFPNKIAIIGGGVIGMEMAAIFLNAGTEVTLIEMLPDILASEDKDIREEMKRQLELRKAGIFLNATVKDLSIQNSQAKVTFQTKGDGNLKTTLADKVLVATGRAPVLNGIDISSLGLETDGPFIKVNRRLETNLPGVYAIGDLIGGIMLAHKASAEAETAVENILGADKGIDSHLIPRCIWGLLEIGAVGMSEEEAVQAGREIKTGRFPYAMNGAAHAMGHVEGLVKVVGDAGTGEILGVHILGAHATDLISEAVSVMAMEGAVEDLYAAIKPHPTLSEGVMEAAMDWNRLGIHTPKR